MKEETKNTPPRGHGRERIVEKPKDFKSAIIRILKELKGLKYIVLIAVLLSLFSALISIVAPKKLIKLTDTISEGLVVKTDKFQELNNKIKTNTNYQDIEIDNIKITFDDQMRYLSILSTIDKNNPQSFYKRIDKMPNSIKKLVEPEMNMNKVISIATLLLTLYIISALLSFFEHIIMANVSNRFAYRIRNDISKKINKLPLSFFDKNTTGNIMSIVTNDIDTITMSLNQSAAILVTSITLFFGSIIMMFSTNVTMALTAILASSIGFILVRLILKNSQKYFIARQKELGKLNGHIEEMYSSMIVVKAYNGKNYSNNKFDKYNKSLYKANIKSRFLSGLMPPIMDFIGNLGYVAVCIVGALLTMNDIITFGVIVAFISYVRMFTHPMSQIAQGLNSLQSGAAASERVFGFIDEKELTKELNKKVLDPKKVKGEIEFKNIEFTYDGNDSPTIKNFSAKVKEGQKIAIVGPTGAGKTTMVNLLMKFYEINKGDILIDGVSIKDLTRENIHDLFTMVLQDTWLFEGTIKDNIKYNRLNIKDDEIERIVKEVGLNHYIKTLSKGYNTYLKANDSISAGQKQLLTIARGMLKESPFLILDEATSNVDTRTEEEVAQAMDKLTKGKTSFIIAHRLSTIKNADLILVMKDGNIIEQGNHETLMNKKGFYEELYNSQFKL